MKILAAVDQSEYAGIVLQKAAELSSKYGAEVTALTVTNLAFTNLYIGETPTEIVSKVREGIKEKVKDIEAKARGIDGKIKFEVEESASPADAIVKYAEKNGIDLIVIGNKGAGAIERFLIGSVSSQVVTHAPCSVLVVKK
ncbi:MAG: universal stress protein [Desulfovibrionales bacterium]|nr:universal stress protein [Desulfovibrionales bacterium]